MLYMPGGKQIIRVHGPFVSDEEVRSGRRALAQAGCARLHPGGHRGARRTAAICSTASRPAKDDAETQLYRKAIQIVAESQKASTSYLQRQLRVGYNSAARLIERMEKDGLGRPARPCRPPRSADRPRRAIPSEPERNGTCRVQSAFNGETPVPAQNPRSFST
jgi:DNA segregation ATPase FtsK/SpoIIIE-like protein